MAYETITAGALLDAIHQQNGFDPDHMDLTDKERGHYTLLVNQAIRRAWEAEIWPQLVVTEKRHYRPTWTEGQNYPAGYEVWHGSGYWRSLQAANVGNEPADDSTWWEAAEGDMIYYIAFDQPWETEVIDETGVDWERCIFDGSPLRNPDRAPVEGCRPFEQSILVPPDVAPLEPWVRYRPKRPRISFVEWDEATGYAAGDVRYRTETRQAYRALQASTGKTPETSTEYWGAVGVPAMFEDYIRMTVGAQRMSEDEGKYKAQTQAENELERVRETYLHIGGDRHGRRVSWRSRR